MKLSQLFMNIAKEMSNDHFFGIPGSGVPLDLMDSGRKIGLDFINVAHESTAAIAAGTYGLIKESDVIEYFNSINKNINLDQDSIIHKTIDLVGNSLEAKELMLHSKNNIPHSYIETELGIATAVINEAYKFLEQWEEAAGRKPSTTGPGLAPHRGRTLAKTLAS